jgi:hypothetical protein
MPCREAADRSLWNLGQSLDVVETFVLMDELVAILAKFGTSLAGKINAAGSVRVKKRVQAFFGGRKH